MMIAAAAAAAASSSSSSLAAATAPVLVAAGALLGRGAPNALLPPRGLKTAATTTTTPSQAAVAATATAAAAAKAARGPAMAARGAPSRGFAAQPAVAEDMFCFQCEQTQDNKGCSTIGVCGKTPAVAGLQDALVYALKGLGGYMTACYDAGLPVPQAIQSFMTGATFSTLTNVNFDEPRFVHMLHEASRHMDALHATLAAAGTPLPPRAAPGELGWEGCALPHPMDWRAPAGVDAEGFKPIAKAAGVKLRLEGPSGRTVGGLQEMLMYGIKGCAAYAHHAEALGSTDVESYKFLAKALAFLASPEAKDAGQVLQMNLELGKANFGVMKMLSDGHARRFGNPTPTEVSLDPVPGKCILVTGHDMADLDDLLRQSAGKGLNVYTHGEMLPAHGYPGLKGRYPHLKGHFGGAWYRQKSDFALFPGAVLVTTNCVLDPPKSYKHRLFTTNETGLAGVQHVPGEPGHKDFTRVIEAALAEDGFTEEDAAEIAQENAEARAASGGRRGVVTVGFGHHAVLSVADQVVDAVKSGKLEHIFVIGGCDGSEPQRKYYDRLAQLMPTNTMVLTLGCGKYRFFDQDFGTVPGTQLPRLLDMGQCNDAYGALVVATELAKVFGTDVNGLPLSLDISWFEQKAVAVLLTLLHLGVKNIRLGPRLPAFLTPDALGQLVEAFAIKPADTADAAADLKRMMARN